MDIKEFAQKLNGIHYGYPQFSDEEIAMAKVNGFVIVSGASDDLMEFEGAIRDEGSCFVRSLDNQFATFSGHTFRHTFATRCFENGVEAKVVQSYLGHASLKMTMDLYTHVTEVKSAIDIEKIVPESKNKVVYFNQKMA